jgi:hypothetical protein
MDLSKKEDHIGIKAYNVVNMSIGEVLEGCKRKDHKPGNVFKQTGSITTLYHCW